MDIIFSLHFADVLDNSFLNLFVQIAAYITPYFLIPATFKFGLGVFGNLAGMINDRSRGLFDRQRKFREGSRQKYRQRAASEKRFAGGNENNWRGSLNKRIARGVNAPGALLDSGSLLKPGGGRWAGAIDARTTANMQAEKERVKKENPFYQTFANDDDVQNAANQSHDAASLRSRLLEIDRNGALEAAAEGKEYRARFADPLALEETVASVEAVRRSMSTGAFKSLTSAGSIAGGTAHKDAFETFRSVALSSGTDASTVAGATAEARSASMSAGRLESGGAGFGTSLGAVQEIQQAYAQAGPNGLSAAEEDALRKRINKKVYKEVLETQGPSTIAHPSLKPRAVEELAPALFDLVAEDAATSSAQYAAATTDDERRKAERKIMQRLASVSSVHDALGGAGTKKGAIIADKVLDQTLDWNQLPQSLQQAVVTKYAADYTNGPPEKVSVQRLMEAARTNEQFQQNHKEYSTAIEQMGSRPIDPGEVGGGSPTTGAAPHLGS